MLKTVVRASRGSWRDWVRTPIATGALAAAAMASLTACNDPTDADIVFASMEDVRALVERASVDDRAVLLIDPRSPGEYARGHIPGAQNIQQSAVPADASIREDWEAYREIIVYGEQPQSGPAKGMTKRLMRVGYDNVRMYEGGLSEWFGANLAVATDLDAAELRPKPAPRSSRME
ncbi:MAG: rhodanese-like domain-containing protein [Planctomycetota bacterium]|nr:rhodanese-like domain-containing protein [Planctomycetota bacterium]